MLPNKEKTAASMLLAYCPLREMHCTTSSPSGGQSAIDGKYVVNSGSKGKEKMLPTPVVCLCANVRTRVKQKVNALPEPEREKEIKRLNMLSDWTNHQSCEMPLMPLYLRALRLGERWT